MSAPLDLQAIEAGLAGAEYTWGRDHELLVTLRALLAHGRALRAALQPFCDPSRVSVSAESVIAERRMAHIYVTPTELQEAAAVLDAVRDAAGAAPEETGT